MCKFCLILIFSFDSKPASTRNAMKLGGKSKDVDSFVDQLNNEGEKIANITPASVTASNPIAKKLAASSVPTEG